MRQFTFLLAATAACGLTARSDAALIIDLFDDPVPPGRIVETDNAIVDLQDGLPSQKVLGGARQISISKTAGAGLMSVRVNATHPGLATLNSLSGVSGDFSFAYGSQAGLPELNSDFSGNDQFFFQFVAADFGGTMDLTVTGGGMTQTISTPFSNGASVLNIPFAQFAAVNFADVDGVKVTIRGVDSFDARIDAMGVVPEPSCMFLAGLGGLLLRRRSR